MKSIGDIQLRLKHLTRPYPARDWLMVLVIAVLILVLGVGYAVYLFIVVREDVGALGAGVPLTETQNAAFNDLDNVLKNYETRQNNFQTGNFSIPLLVDPNK